MTKNHPRAPGIQSVVSVIIVMYPQKNKTTQTKQKQYQPVTISKTKSHSYYKKIASVVYHSRLSKNSFANLPDIFAFMVFVET